MHFNKKWLRRAIDSPVVLALVIFLLALGPRVLDLAVFVGPDEFFWMDSAANFARGLLNGDLAKTYQAGHPGVTLMWIETLGDGLRYGFQWLHGSADWNAIIGPDRTMAMLGSQRQVVAVVNAMLVAFAALLVRQVFGVGVAWLAGFLLAFDPFLLTESRTLRTEGLVAEFSTLALLSLLLFLGKRRVRYAALAGALTGLALLSKVSAAPLLFVGVLVVGGGALFDTSRNPGTRWRTVALVLLAWGGVLLLTVVVFWPALWVAPLNVLRQMSDYVAFRAVEGEGGGGSSFFLGKPASYEELGPLFYPVVLLYRTGPLLWLGLVLLAAAAWPLRELSRRNKVALGIMLLYLALYLGLITNSGLKFDRYTMPMLPVLDIMGAVGLVFAWRWLTRRMSRVGQFGWPIALLALLVHVSLALPHHPYYYTYWNPLLGGLKQAVHVLPVGVGNEGIERVAAYMNTLPSAEKLSLASANSQKIRPLLKGQTIPMTNIDGKWYLADYTFIYISQLQRGKHDPEIIQYLKRKPLVFSFPLFGVDYGWLYQGPGAQYFGGDTKLEGHATLHAYSLSATELSAGQTLTATLYFRNEGQAPSDRFYVRLVDADDYVWAQDTVRPRPGFEDAFRTRKAIVEGEVALALPVGMPPGRYVLKMGYEDAELGQPIGEFVLPADADDIVVKLPQVFPPLGSIQPPVPLRLVVQDELSLSGYELNTGHVRPGQSMWLTLYWQALTRVSHDYVVGLQLLDATGAEVTYWLGRPVRSSYATDQWQMQQVVQDPWRLDLPPEVSPGDYTLRLTLFDAETQAEVGWVSLGQVSVVRRERKFDIPNMQKVVNAGLGDQVTLLGYNLSAEPIMGGGRLRVTLYWQARETMESSYKVFVHLLSPDGAVVAQHDSVPSAGKIPTDDWAVGEVVADQHLVEFLGLPAGEYRLVAGMYDPSTGQRLSTLHGDNTILLETLSIN
jgi:hypothetical protein